MSNLNIPLSVDIEAKPSTNFTTQPQNGAEIVVEQLHKFYGQVKVLEELDLHIQAENL